MKNLSSETAGFSAERLAKIGPAMQRYIDEGKFPGIVSMVARCGRTVHFEARGMQDIKNAVPMQLDSIFRIYSMTKPITSTAIMLLLEEGKLRLADPVWKYIPEFKHLKVAAGRTETGLKLEDLKRDITIRDLLTHTAGFSYGFDDSYDIDQLYQKGLWAKIGRPNTTLKDFMDALAELPLANQPGAMFRYSVAIDVLGYIVEVISGMPFDIFLQKRIFEPLGMPDTSFWVPQEKLQRFAHNYGPDEKHPGKLKDIDPFNKSHYTRPETLFSGGGGLVSTATDYMRFCQMILNRGELEGVRLLGRKTVEAMTINHLPDGMYEDANHAHGFGLGGYVMLNAAQSYALGSNGSWGWGGAANTKFWVDFKEQMIGILMLQYMPSDTYPIEADFMNLTYQALID